MLERLAQTVPVQSIDELWLFPTRRIVGVETSAGRIDCRALVIATGTFLDARIFVGDEVQEGGRRGECASVALGAQVREIGLGQGRLKTGTPPSPGPLTSQSTRILCRFSLGTHDSSQSPT